MDQELKELDKTLKNIQTARPFEDLTVDEVVAARPEIDERVAQLVNKGRWQVPGYKVCRFAIVCFCSFTGADLWSIGEIRRLECDLIGLVSYSVDADKGLTKSYTRIDILNVQYTLDTTIAA